MAEYGNQRMKELKDSDDEFSGNESEEFPSTLMDASLMIGRGPLPFTDIYAGQAHFLERIRHDRKGE